MFASLAGEIEAVETLMLAGAALNMKNSLVFSLILCENF